SNTECVPGGPHDTSDTKEKHPTPLMTESVGCCTCGWRRRESNPPPLLLRLPHQTHIRMHSPHISMRCACPIILMLRPPMHQTYITHTPLRILSVHGACTPGLTGLSPPGPTCRALSRDRFLR